MSVRLLQTMIVIETMTVRCKPLGVNDTNLSSSAMWLHAKRYKNKTVLQFHCSLSAYVSFDPLFVWYIRASTLWLCLSTAHTPHMWPVASVYSGWYYTHCRKKHDTVTKQNCVSKSQHCYIPSLLFSFISPTYTRTRDWGRDVHCFVFFNKVL